MPDVGGSTEPLADLARNSARAAELTKQAADLMSTKPAEAEALLREATSADAFHGPAHNNLGVIHLARNDLPSAASEFELAAKLMPTSPEPRVNLALTLERAGRYQAAADEYTAALEISRRHTRAIQALASLQLRHDLTDDRTPALLDHIALHGESGQWREWARAQRALLR